MQNPEKKDKIPFSSLFQTLISDNLSPQIQEALKASLGGVKKEAWMNLLKYGTHAQTKSQNTEGVTSSSPNFYSQDSLSESVVENTPIVPVKSPDFYSPKPPKKPQSAPPFDPLKATEAGDRFRAVVLILAVLALIILVSWDWILEKLSLFL